MPGLLSNKYIHFLLTGLKWLMISSGLLVGVLILLIVLFMWWGHYYIFRTDSFDQKVWLDPAADTSKKLCYRGGMAGDIKDRLLNLSMTREDVVRLLGKPDGHSTEKEYQYILGLCSGFQIDYDNLHVYFDSSGHYFNSSIVQH